MSRSPDHESRAVIVLAGGRGARLGPGPPKALRPLGGRTLLDRGLDKAHAWAGEVWVSAPPGLELPPDVAERGIPVARDHAAFGPWAGPLVALASSLEVVTSPWALVLAADLPFARADLFDFLWSLRERPATEAPGVPSHARPLGVVPWRSLGPEPLLALYHREAAPILLAATHSGERAAHRAIAALPLVRVTDGELREVDPELESFQNLNTPEEWARAEGILALRGGSDR